MALYSTYTDEELTSMLQLEDVQAFTELYHRYWKRLLYKAGSKLQNIHAAEEIVQDIFLDIWKRRQTLVITGQFQAYIGKALTFRIINYQARVHRDAIGQRAYSATLSEPSDATRQTLDEKELRCRLDLLVSKLPERCRLVYKLREQGYSQKQISTTLNISETTVETQVGRALRVLRTGLSHFFSLLV